MDKPRRSLQEYFAKARREPGITEERVREIVAQGSAARPKPAPWWRRPLSVGLLLVAVTGAGLLIERGREGEPGNGSVNDVAHTSRDPISPNGIAPDTSVSTVADSRDTANDRITSTHTEDTTMLSRRTTSALVASAVAVLGADASAQEKYQGQGATSRPESTTTITIDGTASQLHNDYMAQLGRTTVEFWQARMNEYRVDIDRALSAPDLAELERLRVRWNVLIAKASVKGNLMTSKTEGEMNTETKKGAFSQTITLNSTMTEAAAEFMELHQAAKQIADRNRDAFDRIGEDFFSDFHGFADAMRTSSEAFMEQHRGSTDPAWKDVSNLHDMLILNVLPDIAEKSSELKIAYTMAIEPVIMLFNGTEMKQLFQQAGPVAGVVTGLRMPETSALAQNAPNPASSQTTITYTLREPSSMTLLRVYNAQGEIVGTFDQGAREVGAHRVNVDVAAFPAGTYIYHLTTKTASGEQVYSKAMQVAR